MRTSFTHLNRRFLKLIPIALILALIFSIIGPSTALANPGWYNINWQHRKKITINAANVTGTQTAFPVMISITNDSDLGSSAQLDGDDILFTASDEVTKLPHEIEYFSSNGATANLTAWVRVPTLSSVTDTEIYMYYGNGGAGNQEFVTGTWNDNFKMVQHLEEPSGNTTVFDSTANSNNGTAINSPTFEVAGIIDGAISFTGASNHYINCGNPASLDITQNITVEAWIYLSAGQTNKGIVAKAQTGNIQYMLYLNATGAVTFAVNDGLFGPYSATGSNPTVGAWNHVVGVYNYSNVIVYVNGSQTVGAGYSGALQSTSSIVSIANLGGLTSANAFTGTIDEVRISNSARSSTWIRTSYNNQSNPTSFFTLGAEENATVAPTVTTNNATQVEETSARLHGFLNSDGGDVCQYAFEWGTAPGTYTANISWTGNINTGANFDHLIPGGLAPGEVYYYRAMAKNPAGVSYGAELHFLTKPNAPTNLVATANSSSRIDLSWTKGPGGPANQRTMVRRATGTYPATYNDGIQVYFDTGNNFTDQLQLSANMTYYYRAWSEVTGSQQWSDASTSANATTFPGPTTIGGKVYSVNKAAVLVPWIIIGIGGIIIITGIIIYIRKRITSRPPPEEKPGY